LGGGVTYFREKRGKLRRMSRSKEAGANRNIQHSQKKKINLVENKSKGRRDKEIVNTVGKEERIQTGEPLRKGG